VKLILASLVTAVMLFGTGCSTLLMGVVTEEALDGMEPGSRAGYRTGMDVADEGLHSAMDAYDKLYDRDGNPIVVPAPVPTP